MSGSSAFDAMFCLHVMQTLGHFLWQGLINGADESRFKLTPSGVLAFAAMMTASIAAPMLLQTSPGDPNEAAASPATADADPDDRTYNHFLYLRHNAKGGSAVTDTLVLTKVTPDGFEQRDLFTKRNLSYSKLLGVVGGKVYAVKIGSLIAIDVKTGQAEEIFKYHSLGSYT